MPDPLAPIKDAATALQVASGLPSGLRNFSVLALALCDPAGNVIQVPGGLLVIQATGSTRTLALSDAGKLLSLSGTGGGVAVTVPAQASVPWPDGAFFLFEEVNGTIGFNAGAGVTIRALAAADSTKGQYGIAVLRRIALNLWNLSGDIQLA